MKRRPSIRQLIMRALSSRYRVVWNRGNWYATPRA